MCAHSPSSGSSVNESCAQDTKQKHCKHGSGAPLSSFPLILVVVVACPLSIAIVRFRFCHTSFFSFLFPHPFRHRFGAASQAGILSAARRTEMADVEQMKKIVPFVTCEISFGQNVCELMFGVGVPDLILRIPITIPPSPLTSQPPYSPPLLPNP